MPRIGPQMPLAALATKVLIVISIHTFFPNITLANTAATAAESDFAKSMELTMAVKDHGFKVGEVIVRAKTDGSLSIQRESFITAIRPVFRTEALQALESKLETEFLDPSEISAAGLSTSYNPTDLEIAINPSVEQRPRGEIAASRNSNILPPDIVEASAISGFLNAYLGVAYGREEDHSGQFQYPAALFDGAVRWSDMVLEGEFEVDQGGTIARRATRLVHDMPDEALRLSAGDVDLGLGGLFSHPAMLGFAIEKNYSTLQPTKNIRPTGKRSFRIERHSSVEVLVNNRVVRRLRLAPGEYDLDDLPLTSGTNQVQIRIEDEFGKQETVDFSILFNRTLLEPGIDEWSFAAGTKSRASAASPVYDLRDPVISGTYRRGVSEDYSTGISVLGSWDTALVGVSNLTQTPHGLLSVDSAVSLSAHAGIGWSLATDFAFETERLWERLSSFQLGVGINSDGYVSNLEQPPSDGAQIRLSGSMSQLLTDRVVGSVSGYYDFAEFEQHKGIGVATALNYLVESDLSIGLTGTYARRFKDEIKDGFSLLGRLNYRPSANAYGTLEYDRTTLTTSASLGANINEGDARSAIDFGWTQAPEYDSERLQKVATADLYHSNSRIELNASYTQHFEGLGGHRIQSRRTAVNLGTAIAFADHQFAFGRPVRGGFAIVTPHEDLNGSLVRIDPFQDSARAESDGLGPLLVSGLSAYSPSSLSYDVENLPAGYDLGSGSFNFLAPYNAGFVVGLGSDAAVTAMGTLVDGDGRNVVLKAASAAQDGSPDKKILLFTNSQGRFVIQGLTPGDWTIALNHDPERRYHFTILSEGERLIKLGALEPGE